MTQPCCLNCDRLGHCSETSVDKLLTNYVCSDWKVTKPEEIDARATVVSQFGRAAAAVLVNPVLKEDV